MNKQKTVDSKVLAILRECPETRYDDMQLKHIVDTKGFDYIKANFQYSVLENYNARMDDNYILSREKWWKDTLCTRQFGYNKN